VLRYHPKCTPGTGADKQGGSAVNNAAFTDANNNVNCVASAMSADGQFSGVAGGGAKSPPKSGKLQFM